jgi:hypothetical protein
MINKETGQTADVHPEMERHYAEGGFFRQEIPVESSEFDPNQATKAELIDALTDRGISFDSKAKVAELRQLYLDLPLVNFATGADNKAQE